MANTAEIDYVAILGGFHNLRRLTIWMQTHDILKVDSRDAMRRDTYTAANTWLICLVERKEGVRRSVGLTVPSFSKDIPRTQGMALDGNTLNHIAPQSDFEIIKSNTNVYTYKGDSEAKKRMQEHDWNPASCVCSTFWSRHLHKMTLHRLRC